jgi:hypothetical protein
VIPITRWVIATSASLLVDEMTPPFSIAAGPWWPTI